MKYYERNAEALAAEREKDRQQEENGGTEGKIFYNLKPGRTVLRVLPPFSDSGLWFEKINEYYFRLGDQHLFLTSPGDFGLTDPLFEYNRSVYEAGNDAAIKEALRFRPKGRFLMNVVVLSDASGKITMKDGIKVLKAPTTVKRSMVDYDTDPDYGDITSVHKGFNMIIDRTGEGLKTEYSIKAQRERTNLEEILQQGGVAPEGLTLHDLVDVHRKGLKSEAELASLLEQLKTKVEVAVEAATPAPVPFGMPSTEAPVTVETAPGGPVMTVEAPVGMPSLADLAAPPTAEGGGK